MRGERLFVYGTLRPAALTRAPVEIAAAVRAGAAHEAAGHVRGALHQVSWYPALVEDANGRVRGDIYALGAKLLAELDAYEGDEYERRIVDVALDDGRVIRAWTYFFLDAAQLGARIESGDFLEDLILA